MAFDNSTNHGAMPADGLNAAAMNVNPGGKQPCMHRSKNDLSYTYRVLIYR
jgi:hypothetical protein